MLAGPTFNMLNFTLQPSKESNNCYKNCNLINVLISRLLVTKMFIKSTNKPGACRLKKYTFEEQNCQMPQQRIANQHKKDRQNTGIKNQKQSEL